MQILFMIGEICENLLKTEVLISDSQILTVKSNGTFCDVLTADDSAHFNVSVHQLCHDL